MDRSKWEYKPFEDCIEKSKKTKQLMTSDYQPEGAYPIVSQEASLISGYTDVPDYVNHFDRPVVIFGDHTRVLKYVDFDFAVGADGVKILIPHTNLNAKFLLSFLTWYKIPNLGYSRHYKLLKEISVPVPPKDDQQRIVAELDCLNEMIAVKQEQLKEFDKLAQSIFYDMFEPIDKYVPASHYIESLGGGKSLAGEEECINKVLKTGAVTYDYFKEDEVKNLPKDYEPLEDHLLRDGDLLVSRMNTLEYVGAIAYVWKAPQNTYLPDRLWRAKLKSGANPIYLWFSLKQEKAKEQIRAKASGTSGSMKNISMPKFLSTTIKEAPLSLQQQFADKISAIEAQKELVKQSIAETQSLFNSRMDYFFN